MCPGFSLFALLPESSAIPEFDATSAIRYRPRESGCSLWSRNNCVGLSPSGDDGEQGGQGRAVSRTVREGKGETPERSVRVDEEKEADDDDGYKGGCPSSFSSQTQLRIPPGTVQPTVYGLAVGEAPVAKLNAERFLVHVLLPARFYNIVSLS